MKVLHVLNTASYSGAENVVCQIISMFRGDVEMVYASPDGPIRQVLEDRGIPFFPLKKLSLHEVKRAVRAVRPDVLHAHDFRASLYCAAAGGAPVLSHLHNNPPFLQGRGLRARLYAFSCRRYARILTVSPSVFDEFLLGARYRDKVVCVGNPIDTAAIRARADEETADVTYDIGFCGRLTEQKDPLTFLAVVERLRADFPALRAAMIGDGELRETVAASVRERGLSDCVTLYGFLSNPFPVLRRFRLLCMPSRWEGFGLAAVEGLALGVPVLCSRAGGLSGIVDERCGRLCADVNEYTEEATRVLRNPGMWEDKHRGALTRAAELDNYDTYRAALSGAYAAATKN